MAAIRRRYPPPWRVEEHGKSYIVKDGLGQALAYVYFDDERQVAVRRVSKADALQLARAMTRIPPLLQRD
jgi:hypothetical protein